MSWNPNQGQNPNQQPPYTNYPPPQGNPSGGQQYGYGQQHNSNMGTSTSNRMAHLHTGPQLM